MIWKIIINRIKEEKEMEGKKLVEQAKAWLGKKESDGSFREIIDLYNSHTPLARGYKVKYTDSWCAAFVSAAGVVFGGDRLWVYGADPDGVQLRKNDRAFAEKRYMGRKRRIHTKGRRYSLL
jgi:hypothetical protein